MATSTNFGWTEPDDTDLVKDGASAMRTLGNAIDSTVWTVAGYAAGKNKIINGDFGIWQRGTSFSNPINGAYTADRMRLGHDGTGGTLTVSQQAFTAGTAPVAGYESSFFYRYNWSVAQTGATTNTVIGQNIEDVRTFAGQTITVSFWAKADTARTLTPQILQRFGTGGSSTVITAGSAINITTSWVRYSQTFAVPSIAGKTIGTSNSLGLNLNSGTLNATYTFDIWGIQVEAGSTATPFQTATGTIQGELAACQRYCINFNSSNANGAYLRYAVGQTYSATEFSGTITLPVPMRTVPSLTTSGTASNYAIYVSAGVTTLSGDPTIGANGTNNQLVNFYAYALGAGFTVGRAAELMSNNNNSSYLLLTAEL